MEIKVLSRHRGFGVVVVSSGSSMVQQLYSGRANMAEREEIERRRAQAKHDIEQLNTY